MWQGSEADQKDAEKKSVVLVRTHERAQAVSIAAELEKRNERIWEAFQAKQKAMVLNDKPGIRFWSQREDLARGERTALQRDRLQKIEQARLEWETFIKPHRKRLVDRIQKTFTRLEREKNCVPLGESQEDAIGRPKQKISTNVIAVLQCQQSLSACAQKIREAVCIPLSEMTKMVDEAMAGIPEEFERIELTLIGGEIFEFQLEPYFPSRKNLENEDWESPMLSADTIRHNIACVVALQTPRQEVAA
jgi:hypothetical protein